VKDLFNDGDTVTLSTSCTISPKQVITTP